MRAAVTFLGLFDAEGQYAFRVNDRRAATGHQNSDRADNCATNSSHACAEPSAGCRGSDDCAEGCRATDRTGITANRRRTLPIDELSVNRQLLSIREEEFG